MKTNRPLGYLTLTLHSHLPYVLNHGTWPHGSEWLHEAAAETYLPLLRVLEELEQQGAALKPNVNLSPILLEQLAHPVFKSEFVGYVARKIESAEKDARTFDAAGDPHMAGVARFWKEFYQTTQRHFERLGGEIISGFKRFYDSGAIEIITCGATHGYFPLLGTDNSIRAQVRVAVATHKRFFGRKPRGIWLPECGYRPAGRWQFPVCPEGSSPSCEPFNRVGVEQILAENGIEYFFVDTHLVETGAVFTPYPAFTEHAPVALELPGGGARASLYQPYLAKSGRGQTPQVAFFTRDPRTGIQVWSGQHGYPGDPHYLDFHKKRWPGGHRYWQVTDPKVDLADKTPYYPERALERTKSHASHFAHIAAGVLADNQLPDGQPPILTAPFDAELFGHWWFEGPQWLKHVALQLAHPESRTKTITCGDYLDLYPASGALALGEGSWGANGTNEVWLNPETAWTWKQIYPAELAVRDMAAGKKWQGHAAAERLAKQMCRELLLLESSDWQFLITTIAARDYAEKRFDTHRDQLRALQDIWNKFESSGEISGEAMAVVEGQEQRDSVFADITPDYYIDNPS